MLFLFQTINFFDKLVFGLSAVPMMKELSLSPKEFGLIGSSFFLLFSLSGMAVGLFVVGRFPAKWILMLLAAIWSATQLPVFFSNSVMVLVVCRILLGAGEGPGLPTALHTCYNWFPADKRSVPSAVVLQGISVGLLAGGPLLTYVIISHGWRTGFLVCGLLGIAWMIAWSVIGGEGPYAAANVSARCARGVAKRAGAVVVVGPDGDRRHHHVDDVVLDRRDLRDLAAAVPAARARLQADRCRLDHFGDLHVPVAAAAQRFLDHAGPAASRLEPARVPW